MYGTFPTPSHPVFSTLGPSHSPQSEKRWWSQENEESLGHLLLLFTPKYPTSDDGCNLATSLLNLFLCCFVDMSCQNAIRGVWEIFTGVTEAVENYKIAEPDRESSGLKRDVATEKAVFHQTSERLQRLLSSSTFHDDSTQIQQPQAGLDMNIKSKILDDLEILTRQLNVLKVDLVNAGRGKV